MEYCAAINPESGHGNGDGQLKVVGSSGEGKATGLWAQAELVGLRLCVMPCCVMAAQPWNKAPDTWRAELVLV